MNDHDPLAGPGYIDSTPYAISAVQPHFPKFTPQMPDMRLTNTLQSDRFDSFSQSQKCGLNIGRQVTKFSIHHRPKRLNLPSH